MNCQEIQALKHVYLDGELDPVRTMESEAHLRGCPACSQAYDSVRALTDAMKSSNLYFVAPPQLKERVRASLPRGNANSKTRSLWLNPWTRLGVAAACGALLAVLLVPSLTAPPANNRLVQDVASSHIRSLMADHLTDVRSSDRHTVKPWFDGKLDFAPPVVDPAEQGFPLVGGRLDYVQDRPVAALVYQRRQHVINVFIWPVSESSATVRKAVYQGYNLIQWNESGMTFWAVSDLNRDELESFADLIRGQAKPSR